MMHNTGRWLTWAIVIMACATPVWGGDAAALRAYPNPLPEDANFDTVVKSQPFPFMKYPVNIIGAKVHPEEFHVTPSGQLVLPYTEVYKGLCVAALVGLAPTAAPIRSPWRCHRPMA